MLSTKTIVIAGAGLAAAAGLALAGASLAGAEGVSSATTSGYGYGHAGGAPGYGTPGERPQGGEGGAAANGNTDPSKPMRSDETLLTGDTAAKVTAAAQAKEPGATIERVETDSEGVYEAHMVRADGTHIIVQVGADFAVTSVQEHAGGPGGGKGRSGGGQPPSGSPSGGATGGAETPSGTTSSS